MPADKIGLQRCLISMLNNLFDGLVEYVEGTLCMTFRYL